MAPSTSNFASPRVLPPLATASAISSSRCACKVFDQARSISPRCAKLISRSGAAPVRACSSAAVKSIPPVPARARGSSVAGFTKVARVPCPSTQRP